METPLEKLLERIQKEKMLAFVAQNPESFDEAVQLIVSNKQPYAWRAAWLVGNCMNKNDVRIAPYLDFLVAVLPERTYNQQRELLNILFEMDLDEENEGLLFEHCISIWERVSEQSSLRFYALKQMVKTGNKYPELKSEIKLLLSEQYLDTFSSGIRNSIKKLVKW